MTSKSNLVPVAELAATNPVKVISQVVDSCSQACNCCFESEKNTRKMSAKKRLARVIALYATMVLVSTIAIYFLEHASVFSAIRTALVAAIGKTVAATWVSHLFS